MKDKLIEVHRSIQPYIHNTPVFTSKTLNNLTGAELFFKCENFQRMGAFKMRGAVNALLHLTNHQKSKGVVTHSSGNFAQALSLAAKSLGIKAYVVMPSNSPVVKKEAVKGYGGIVIECPPTPQAREDYTEDLIRKMDLTFIHPSNDWNVILGQGTAAMELIEEIPSMDYLYCPVGGGGLISGTLLAVENFSPHTRVVGSEPRVVDDAYRSLISGRIETHNSQYTIADGLRTLLGDVTFPIIQKKVDRIIRVEEFEIKDAMRLIWQRMKLVVEPSSAVALAAVLKEKNKMVNNRIGIILSGGNVDFEQLPFQ